MARGQAGDSFWFCPTWGGQKEKARLLGLPPCTHLSKPERSFSFSVATRIEQRKKMNCKSFRWYLDNVYPELT